MVTASEYMILSSVLFAIGFVGFTLRRNILVMFMSAELMLNAANLNLIGYSTEWGNPTGQTFALFVIAVAAAEAAIGLAILMLLFRARATVSVTDWRKLKG
ncbi:MAG: NADH-quinone oxidoreductase subunit NuoK [Candidatus Lindowbacteria bacterium]|nr:NADH-quinone oxidoreductase subunit NuoK [Candidatus Lindowbacteria bacterium]